MSRRALFAVLALAPLCPLAAMAQQRQAPVRAPTQESGGGIAVPQPKVDKQFPVGASWTAVSVGGKPLPGERPSMVLDDQLRAKGFSGCNTFSATAYPLAQQGFAVGPIAVTRKACEPALMTSERTFLTALRGARKWDVVEGRLVLTGVAGEIRFERAL